jgi:hypothetical protein
VTWRTADGHALATGELADQRGLLRLLSPAKQAPRAGERLEVRNVWQPANGAAYEVRAVLAFSSWEKSMVDKAVIQQVIDTFNGEFAPVAARFSMRVLSIQDVLGSTDAVVQRPGVYVFLHPTHGVLRVGRHLENVQSRVQQHWRKWMEGCFPDMAGDRGRVVLFTVDRPNRHWVAAVEIYLETNLAPHCRQRRIA